MSDFGETCNIVGRKRHRCEWCLGPIPKSESHKQFKGMWDGEWQNWRMHNECYDIYIASDDIADGFMPGEGEMPERIKKLVQEEANGSTGN